MSAVLPVLVALAAAMYLVAAAEQAHTPRGWPAARTAAFLTGALVLALAGAFPDGPSAHVASHLLAGMVAPVGLVLGAPVTLLLRASGPPVRRAVGRALRSRVVRTVSHPVTALLLAPGGAVLLYLTPLHAATLRDPLLHELVQLHVVASGYLLAWVVAGPDPAPHRPGIGGRTAVLVAAAAVHAVLAKVMYAGGHPRGTGHDPEALRAAAQLMYYGGDVAELLLAAALFGGWYRARARADRRRAARRPCRRGAMPDADRPFGAGVARSSEGRSPWPPSASATSTTT